VRPSRDRTNATRAHSGRNQWGPGMIALAVLLLGLALLIWALGHLAPPEDLGCVTPGWRRR
jgi:hypothetical protein